MKTTLSIIFATLALAFPLKGQFLELNYSQEYADFFSDIGSPEKLYEHFDYPVTGFDLFANWDQGEANPLSIPELTGSTVFDLIFVGPNPTSQTELNVLLNLDDSDKDMPWPAPYNFTNNGKEIPGSSISIAAFEDVSNPEVKTGTYARVNLADYQMINEAWDLALGYTTDAGDWAVWRMIYSYLDVSDPSYGDSISEQGYVFRGGDNPYTLFSFFEWDVASPNNIPDREIIFLAMKGVTAPIPEASFFGSCGVIALAGLILLRTFRVSRRKHSDRQ